MLDIQMPGMDGMETARRLRERGSRVILIFLTALEEYVFQAFDVGAFHYLVKPVEDGKFLEVLQRAAAQYQAGESTDMRNLSAADKGRYLMVLSGGIHVRVYLDDIVYAEVFNRKVLIHRMDEDVEYYGKLSELERQAGEDFFRTHRAYLVHFKYVVKYDASAIWLEKGKALMAKQNYQEFVRKFMKYNQRGGRDLRMR